MTARRFALGLLIIFCARTVSARPDLSTMRGIVVAFRPAERLGQVVSGAVNKETFLLQVAGKTDEIVKIIYAHGGYSEISGAAAESSVTLTFGARRDHSCDGTYGQYVSEAPSWTSEDKTNSIPPITMLGGFNGLPQSYKLKCYRLGRGSIRTE